MRKVMTAEQVKAQFHLKGITVTAWAEEHGFKTSYVYAVLNGRMYDCNTQMALNERVRNVLNRVLNIINNAYTYFMTPQH